MVRHVDLLGVYRQQQKYTGPTLDSFFSKNIPEGKILYEEQKDKVNWHRFVKEHGPDKNSYAAYTVALIQLEEGLCSK